MAVVRAWCGLTVKQVATQGELLEPDDPVFKAYPEAFEEFGQSTAGGGPKKANSKTND